MFFFSKLNCDLKINISFKPINFIILKLECIQINFNDQHKSLINNNIEKYKNFDVTYYNHHRNHNRHSHLVGEICPVIDLLKIKYFIENGKFKELIRLQNHSFMISFS